MMRRNFFTDIFAMGLTSFVELGIYGRWHRNYWLKSEMASQLDLGKVNKFRNTSLEPYHDRGKDVGPEATTLEQVTIPFVIYLSMALAALTVFIKECKHDLNIILRSGCTNDLVKSYDG